jgi:hypothetical protein
MRGDSMSYSASRGWTGPVPDATWGLHLVDANIALGNLTDLVGKQISAYVRKNR